MINVGIIGLGHVATHQVAALETLEDFRLAAGCDPDTSRHALLGDAVAAFVAPDEFLQHPDLDVVVVASPNGLHVEHGLKVISAGKWLVMEKPLADTRADFDEFTARKQELAGNCTLALHAAFGKEVEWFLAHQSDHQIDLRSISSFSSEFCDPYIENGELLPQASSLGGSWVDSGVNALSVICRLISPEDLIFRNSQMRRDSQLGCLESEGHVEFEFSRQDSATGKGAINTSWVAGRDSKITEFGLDDGNDSLVLDHSLQRVLLRHRDREQILYACDNGLPRLTNHYIGIFEDLATQLKSGKDNFEYGRTLHQFLYLAEEWPEC